MSKKLKELEEAVQDILSKDRGGRKLTAADIMAMVDEVAKERIQEKLDLGAIPKPVRQVKSFRFDVTKLQALARQKMIDEELTHAQVWERTGIAVAPLHKHLGDRPPVEMGLGVAVSLMAWTGEFDLLGFLLED